MHRFTHLTILVRFCVLLSAAFSTAALASDKIGLVLGGGGARGAAHIGVLKVLEEQGIAVDYIAGTSMGAIVGALYASGYRPDEIESILANIDWQQSLRDSSPRPQRGVQNNLDSALIPASVEVGIGRDGIKTPQGLLQGQHVLLLLKKFLLASGDLADFDDLPIPFRAIASDIANGDQVVLGNGDLATAVRASMSLPGVFQPVRIDGRLLVDGGIVDNVPIQVVRDMGATRVIAVDVGSPPLKPEQLGNPTTVLNQVVSVLISRQVQASLDQLHEGDVLIRPDIGDISTGDFDRSMETVAPGEAAALAQIDKLRGFAASPDRLAAFNERAESAPVQGRIIGSINVDHSQTRFASLVRSHMADLRQQPLDTEQLERRISAAYGSGKFEQISYQVHTLDNDEIELQIVPVDKTWGPNFLRLGLLLSDDFQGDSAYQIDALARVVSDLSQDAEWRFNLGLGDRSEVGAGWLGYFGQRNRFFINPSLNWQSLDQPLFIDAQRNEFARFRWNTWRAGVRMGSDLSSTTRVFLDLQRGHDDLKLRIGPGDTLPTGGNDFGFVGLGLIHDSIDNLGFPRSGLRVDARAEFYLDALGTPGSTEVYRLDLQKAFAWGDYSLLTSFTGVTSQDDDITLQSIAFLGGLANLSGFSERQVIGTQLLFARAVGMRRLFDENELFALPLYLGASIETGNVWLQRDQVDLDDLIYAGSAFLGVDSPLGPIYLGVGHSSVDRTSVYLNFGSLIRALD